jgi:hypothetical protein
VKAAVAAVLVAAALAAHSSPASPGADEKAPSALAKAMVGTWALAGKPGEVVELPKAGGRLKFITGRHWVITESDPETHKVVFHHGGTYTLDGDEHAETVEYANENTAGLIGQTFRFKVKVEGDTYTQVGIGNPYTEVWKRLK